MALDFHLERKLRFNASSEYKSLYSWSLGELDDFNNQRGSDQIPWPWTLYFTAVEIVLQDDLEIEETEIGVERRSIHVKLQPGDQRSRKDSFRRTTFRMFGTDREIKDFTLDICPLASDDDKETCTAWGSVSYEGGIDFHPETTDDVVSFFLMLKPGRFQRYVDRISVGTVDELVLSVKGVKGFYSEWSPDILTTDIKVLCGGDEQIVKMPAGIGFDLPRLSDVYEARLFVRARIQAKQWMDDLGSEDEPSKLERSEVVKSVMPRAAPQLATLLRKLSTLARWVIGLLSMLIIVTLWKA